MLREQCTGLADGVDVEGPGRGGVCAGSQGWDWSSWVGMVLLLRENWCGTAGEEELCLGHVHFPSLGRFTEVTDTARH